MRINRKKIEKWAEQFDELSYQISEIYDYINQAETECSEITYLQSDIYHGINDDELDTYEIQDICNNIDRHAEDTIGEIGNAQYIFDDKCNGINKKLDSLYKEFDDLLEPNLFTRLYQNVRLYINKALSYRISLKIVQK